MHLLGRTGFGPPATCRSFALIPTIGLLRAFLLCDSPACNNRKLLPACKLTRTSEVIESFGKTKASVTGAPKRIHCGIFWRRGRDSNPRYRFWPVSRFRNSLPNVLPRNPNHLQSHSDTKTYLM